MGAENDEGGRARDVEADAERSATDRPIRFSESFRAVFWSFFGVRKRRDLERDAARLNPVHVVITAFVMMALFIAILVTVVHFVVSAK
ncbi:DUF2970 domain-containing protein [Pararobbsia silviterrae]|uniref:DUF2970 domain-containing protein n=1 Tax=Pararobbsia silviterrae TaxID=1792498 RepID=A0A494Y7W9_9BURK|nr:DUF2970 domain-containing protein [Pararobbsia silviterrae]